MKFFSLLSLLLSTTAFSSDRYVTIPYEGQKTLVHLHSEGYDVAGVNLENRTVTIVVGDEDLGRMSALPVLSTREVGFPDTAYKHPRDIEKTLFQLEQKFPQLAIVEQIGESGEHRPLYAIQITSRFFIPDQPKKVLLVDAMHHAREVMTPEVALDMAQYLLENYQKDPKVFGWLNYNEIWIVPMMNPDGNNKVWNSKPMWRKNNREGYGVDVNRNYPHAWNTCNGSSGSKSSDTYRGPSPGSEPETKAIMALANRIKPHFNLSYHSFSEIVIYPYGCSPLKIPAVDRAKYEGIGKELAKKLVRDSGSGNYTAGTSYELLYNVDGGSIDWMYAQNKTFAYVIEVNSDAQGFQPSYAKWRDKTITRQRPGWMYILDKMSENRKDFK